MARTRRALALSTVLVTAVTVPAVPAMLPVSAAVAGDRTEVVLETDGDVVVSEVTWRSPLPAGTPAHPPACDTISYLRYRLAGGPADPAAADAVISAQAGADEGAASLDPLARNTVHALGRLGTRAEFWAMDRRDNCLEDATGALAAIAADDYRVALGYYFEGAEVGGQRFAGFQAPTGEPVQAELGIRRIIEDWHDIHTREIPDPALRKRKLFVGGHSFGASMSAMYSSWDFDGNASTVDDAGYNQVAAYIGLDGPVVTRLPSRLDAFPTLNAAKQLIGLRSMATVNTMLRSNLLPRTLFPPPAQEVVGLFTIAGLGARLRPDAETELLRRWPAGLGMNTTGRLLLSRDYTNFLTGIPDFRDYRLTNEAMLGTFFDDNTLGTLASASFGTYDGGPVAEKTVPLGTQLNDIPGLRWLSTFASDRPRMIPTDQRRLYTWRDYDEVDRPYEFPQHTDDGRPFTTPADERASIRQVARAVGSGRLNYLEFYPSTRQYTDAIFLYTGNRTGDLRFLMHEDFKTRLGGVQVISSEFLGKFTGTPLVPAHPTPILAEPYSHSDVINAAALQNDGQPDIVLQSVVDLVTRTID